MHPRSRCPPGLFRLLECGPLFGPIWRSRKRNNPIFLLVFVNDVQPHVNSFGFRHYYCTSKLGLAWLHGAKGASTGFLIGERPGILLLILAPWYYA